MKNMEVSITEMLSELEAEELEPRLELQVLVDPLAAFCDSMLDNNCSGSGTCNIKPD
jgi:DNA-binding ferritin-like protein (Dps family)